MIKSSDSKKRYFEGKSWKADLQPIAMITLLALFSACFESVNSFAYHTPLSTVLFNEESIQHTDKLYDDIDSLIQTYHFENHIGLDSMNHTIVLYPVMYEASTFLSNSQWIITKALEASNTDYVEVNILHYY